ncbi:GTP-binding protein [Prolixibacter sp. SD074]|jgi:CO dehydrogenase nickel-insertion accessory protein CooC1|uniref:GTP-binding protein n=1 Tax=Prolixibacter sp. SD074 TaxID=2652391 RepID=UPI00127EFB7D|nr:GTP-binding protein [Prolixibacter sp. SD074]GET30513.1 hypothetical protein SD074_27150 [Prolixibacter sp. SD074]
MARPAKQIILLGFNGTGKTTLTRKFVESEVKRGGKVLVITPDFAEWNDLPETLLEKPTDLYGKMKAYWQKSTHSGSTA